MADSKSKSLPLVNKGVNTKIEPGLLSQGQFQSQSNITSTQEGSISLRQGSKKFTNAASMDVVHSMAKAILSSTDATNPRYIGAAGKIWRVTGPYTTYQDISVSLALNSQKWEGIAFDSSGSGRPVMYFAHQSRMMRDDGSFSTAKPWGILPPFQPVVTGLADINNVNYPGFVLLTSQSTGASRVSTTVSSAVAITPGYYKITPASMADILPGMYVSMTISGSPTFVVVDKVDFQSFYAYCSSVPSGAIHSYSNPINKDSGGSPVSHVTADGNTYHADFTFSVDWSFKGIADNGYDTDDLVHFGIFIGSIDAIKEIRIRVFVGGSTVDFYEKSVAPSTTQAYVSQTVSGLDSATARALLIQAGVPLAANLPEDVFLAALQSGQFDQILSSLTPAEIPGVQSSGWFEFDVSKLEFLKNGNAGTSANSWKNVTDFEVLVITNVIGGSPTSDVLVGAIYAHGAQGPDSTSSPAANSYDWLYTFRDPTTGAEGNPCQAQDPMDYVSVQKRAVSVTVYGCDTADGTGNPAISGFGSIAIYRRGGTYSDGLYRFVGYSANPGVSAVFPGGTPNAVTFIDNSSDIDIQFNRIIDFDNDPPVTSTPNNPLAGTIGAALGGSGVYSTFVLANTTGKPLSSYLSVGSLIHIGDGTNAEDAIVAYSNDGTVAIQCWTRKLHVVGEQVTCNAIIGQPCDVVCQAGDSLLVAGDPNNVHVVYKSKPGRPHAFPPVNLTTGTSYQLHVSAPGNPVNGIVDFGGEYAALCLDGIYVFNIWQGQMLQAQKTPADRGLIAKHLWCKVGAEIWYLSNDGIYAWGGGGSRKVTDAIDWVFRNRLVGGYYPVDYNSLQFADMDYYEGCFWFIYKDTNGSYLGWRYFLTEDRWEPITYNFEGDPRRLTALMFEPDTKRLMAGIYNVGEAKSSLHQLETGRTDSWVTVDTDGFAIQYQAKTAFMSPEDRLTQILLQDLVIEINNPSGANPVTVKVYYDFSGTPDGTDAFTITSGARRRVALPIQQGAGTTQGKECYVAAIEFSGQSLDVVDIYSIGFRYAPLAQIQRGQALDWSDLGHPWDKRFYECTIEFNTFGNAITLNLDLIGGVGGGTPSLGVQALALPAVNNRAKQAFPINDGTIAKLVRLRANVAATDFEIFDVQWVKEDYPPDIVRFTESTDKGIPFPKFIQQLVLDVNTNGQTVPVTIEADGVAAQTVNISSTLSTRSQRRTMTPAIQADRMRLVVGTVPGGGMFQLFSHDYVVEKADRGSVGHSFDWDDLGSPYPKLLQNITFEYDINGGGGVTMQMDMLVGSDGTLELIDQLQFVLTGGARSKQTFALPPDTIVTMIRLRPANTSVSFKSWKYEVAKVNFPPPYIGATLWDDDGWPYEKVLRSVEVEIDTGGVACSLQLQVDGASVGAPWSVTTTSTNRAVILTPQSNIIGKLFRLVPTWGTGGQAQIFKVHYTVWREPPYLTHWDSYEIILGHASWKFMKQVWVEFICPSVVTVSIYRENNVLLYQKVLPAHAHRDVERFLVPDAVGAVLNKSRAYRITVDAAAAFKLYVDASRFEIMQLSGDQRACFEQHQFDEFTQPQVR